MRDLGSLLLHNRGDARAAEEMYRRSLAIEPGSSFGQKGLAAAQAAQNQ